MPFNFQQRVYAQLATGFVSGPNTVITAADSLLVALQKAQGQISALAAGTVASVTGTANRITIGGTATNPVVDISAAYVGQSSITTVGTLTAGTTGAGFTVALGASTITGVLLGTNGGTGVANTGKTITLGGNLTTTGAFNTSLTQQGSFTITLPNATSTLLANNLGIAGGSTLIGGTSASETLTLKSTSNATKGNILFGTSAYDEVNNRLGIGLTTPTCELQIGSGTAPNFPREILVSKNSTGLVGLVVRNSTTNGSRSIAFEEDGTNCAFFSKLGSAAAGNFISSIPNAAAMVHQSGNVGQQPFYIYATPIIGVVGATTTNIGFRNDATGFRIDQTANNNTTNLNAFTVNGKSFLGGNSTNSASWLQIAAGTTTVSSINLVSGTLKTTAAAGDIEYNGTNLSFTKTGTTRGTVYVATPRNYSSVSLANNTARTPSSTNDIEVVISFSFANAALQSSSVTIQVDNSGGGTFTTIATLQNGAAAVTDIQAITFICPMTSQYKFVTAGTGTITVSNHFELTL